MATAVSSPLPLYVAAVVICCVGLLTMTATALPMKEAVGQAERDGRQHQQPLQQLDRENDQVDQQACARPTEQQLFIQFVSVNPRHSPHFLSSISNTTKRNDSCLSSLHSTPSSQADDNCPCPYYLTTLDTAHGAFPARLKMAHCTLQKCQRRNAYGCRARKVTVHVLRLSGCQSGQQTFQAEAVETNVDCFCHLPGKRLTTTASATPSSSVEPWWVD